MNKLDVSNLGGFPAVLDDLDFLTAGLAEALKGIMSAFGINPNDPFIISGCGTTGGNYADGFIYMGGEIFRVDAAPVPSVPGGSILYWSIIQTTDSTGTKNMEDGNIIQAYLVRKAKMVALSTPPAVYIVVSTAKTLADKIKAIVDPSNIIGTYGPSMAAILAAINNMNAAWNNYTLTLANISYGNAHTPTIDTSVPNSLKFRKVGKTVTVDFTIGLYTSVLTEGAVYIALPGGAGVPTRKFLGTGYFHNTSYGSLDSGGNIGQHNLFLYAEPAGGGRIFMTPSDYRNFYFSASNVFYGQVTFEIA